MTDEIEKKMREEAERLLMPHAIGGVPDVPLGRAIAVAIRIAREVQKDERTAVNRLREAAIDFCVAVMAGDFSVAEKAVVLPQLLGDLKNALREYNGYLKSHPCPPNLTCVKCVDSSLKGRGDDI